jgi:hypothetical protein
LTYTNWDQDQPDDINAIVGSASADCAQYYFRFVEQCELYVLFISI